MKRGEWTQILTFALVAVMGVGLAFAGAMKFLGSSRAQEGAGQPLTNEQIQERLQQVPLAGEGAADALKAAQEAAAAKEAAAAAAVGMPAVDPNQGMTTSPVPDAGGQLPANEGSAPGGAPNGNGGGTGSSNTISGISELEGFLEPFIYDEANRRDPFLAYGVTVQQAQESEAPRILAPIQKFPLSEFRLVAVLWDVKTPKAMVMSSSSELFVLERDQSIGIDNGYVAAIRESEIVVVEPVKKRGDVTYKTTIMRMDR